MEHVAAEEREIKGKEQSIVNLLLPGGDDFLINANVALCQAGIVN